MNPILNQIVENVVPISIFLVAAGIFCAGAGWGLLAIIRMLQVAVATNITLSRELSAIQHVIGKIPGGTSPAVVTGSPPKADKDNEGEFIPYDEELMARQEELLRNQQAAKERNGLSDAALQEHLNRAVGDVAD